MYNKDTNNDFILANEIKFLIENDNYKAGDCLPSERSLCKRFNVQRLTIRSALRILEEEGMIRAVAKSGYYLNNPRIVKKTTSIFSLTDELFQMAIDSKTKLLCCKLIEAKKNQNGFLKCTLGEKFYYIERLRTVDNVPICLDTSYISQKNVLILINMI
ncbi:MAG: GntR family transcriptional regulator [Erysipelotrichia bacterium]|nr:GntR family transcriptional regulator [Erysipelotrichia bacterium]